MTLQTSSKSSEIEWRLPSVILTERRPKILVIDQEYNVINNHKSISQQDNAINSVTQSVAVYFFTCRTFTTIKNNKNPKSSRNQDAERPEVLTRRGCSPYRSIDRSINQSFICIRPTVRFRFSEISGDWRPFQRKWVLQISVARNSKSLRNKPERSVSFEPASVKTRNAVVSPTPDHRAPLASCGQLRTIPVPFFRNTGTDPPPGTTPKARCLFPSMHCSWFPTVTRSSGRFSLSKKNQN